MKLLLDIGNTRIKWAYAGEESLLQPGEIVHRDRLPAALTDLAATLSRQPSAIVAVNVAGQDIGARVAAALRESFNVDTRFLTVAEQHSQVINGYTEWQQLGVDRWAAIVGAWQQLQTDVCVVDAGTAVTIDLVQADGRHLGGVILPGLGLMEQSLGLSTADIADFAAAEPGPGEPDWYGRATAEAVQRGAQFSICAAIDRAVEKFPTGARPTALLTGGDATKLQAGINVPCEVQPMLVLEGVRELAASDS